MENHTSGVTPGGVQYVVKTEHGIVPAEAQYVVKTEPTIPQETQYVVKMEQQIPQQHQAVAVAMPNSVNAVLQGGVIYVMNSGSAPQSNFGSVIGDNSTILIQDPVTKTYQLARISSASTTEWSAPTSQYQYTSVQPNFVINQDGQVTPSSSSQQYAFQQTTVASSNEVPEAEEGFGMEVVVNTEPDYLAADQHVQPEPGSTNRTKQKECNICQKVLCNKDSLRRHMKMIHSIDMNGTPASTPSPTPQQAHIYKCDICHKVLCNKDSVRRHKKALHQGDSSSSANTSMATPPEIRFILQDPLSQSQSPQDSTPVLVQKKKKKAQCDICNKFLYNKATVLRHKATMHVPDFRAISPSPPTPPPPPPARIESLQLTNEYVCNICNNAFSDNGTLKKHKLTVHHIRSKSEACHICGKVLYDKGVMQRHMKNIHKVDPSSIPPSSDSSVASPSSSSLPQKKKYKPRRHVCNICDKTLYDKACLKRHLKAIHKIEVLDSPIDHSQAAELLHETLSVIRGGDQSPTSFETASTSFSEQESLATAPNERSTPAQSPRSKDKVPTKHKCEECQETFANSSNLRRHQVLVHQMDVPNYESVVRSYRQHNVIPQKCEVCNRTIIGRSNLVRHQRQVHKMDVKSSSYNSNSNSNSCSFDGMEEENVGNNEFMEMEMKYEAVDNSDNAQDAVDPLSFNGGSEIKTDKEDFLGTAFNCLSQGEGTPVELQEVEVDKSILGGIKNEIFELNEVQECVAALNGQVIKPGDNSNNN